MTHIKYDYVLNNMSEAFNSVILESRTKPLVIGKVIGWNFQTYLMWMFFTTLKGRLRELTHTPTYGL